ncbi:hypothetical protein YPPY08_4163 [Yersinia pestis PY-08]|uniref:Uncharacterized protein n=1 Tax=Yersinia pestis PY-08 TaxID=992134 RepID=A0AB72ZEH0_YERPE|nr:hypothetical protein YpF1991016_2363 [Yersinia pestis biovar Orientalis str. F1991016]EIR13482.1 hypothetical protein YPPY08_4163 [Yersinia pestis PY-08]
MTKTGPIATENGIVRSIGDDIDNLHLSNHPVISKSKMIFRNMRFRCYFYNS